MKLIQSRAGVCFLLRPSIQSGLSCATKGPAGRFVYAPGLHFFYGALRAVFSASALDTIGPQRRYEVAHWTISLTRRP